MALYSFDQVDSFKGELEQPSEAARFLNIRNMRRLFKGDWAPFFDNKNIDDLIRPNWFRIVSEFYADFLYAIEPTITIEGNEPFTRLIANSTSQWFPSMHGSVVDMVRYGEAVVSTHPLHPLRFICWEPDQWYEVVDDDCEVVGDIFVRVRDKPFHPSEEVADVYAFRVDGPSTWNTYHFESGSMGQLIKSRELPARQGRQVITTSPNIDGSSLFPGMLDSIKAMAVQLGSVHDTIDGNLHPHMFGPDGSLERDDGGNYKLEPSGMFFPLQQGDGEPGYLQWDSNLEAVEWSYTQLTMNALNYAALSPVLFDPKMRTGDLTGVALKRLNLPTYLRLNHYRGVEERAIEDLISIVNGNLAAADMEVYDYQVGDIDFSWGFESLFDVDEAPKEDEEDNNGG